MPKIFLFLLEKPKRPRFSIGQLNKLSDIFINLGILLIGSVVLPSIMPSVDNPSLALVILGIIASLSFWIIAVLLAKEVDS